MSQKSQIPSLSIQDAERKAYQLSTSQDGLYDVFIGSYIGMQSALPWLDENGLPSPWNVILVLALGLLVFGGVILFKKFIVVPRIGLVRYGIERNQHVHLLR